MTTKRAAHAAHFEGIKDAMDKHMAATEAGLRTLPGMATEKVDKIVASVRKQHDKLVQQIDQQIAVAEPRDRKAASEIADGTERDVHASISSTRKRPSKS